MTVQDKIFWALKNIIKLPKDNRFIWQRSGEYIYLGVRIISACYYNRIITELLIYLQLEQIHNRYYPSRNIELNCIFFDYIKLNLLISKVLCFFHTVAKRNCNRFLAQRPHPQLWLLSSWSCGHLRACGCIEEQAITARLFSWIG